MRQVRYVVALVGLFVLAGCSNIGQPLNTPNAEPVCIALGGLNARVNDFRALDPATASIDDYRNAAYGVSGAYQTLDAQIRTLAQAQATQLQVAFGSLQSAAQALPAGTTPAQAREQLSDELAGVDSAMESARSELDCPPFPTPGPS